MSEPLSDSRLGPDRAMDHPKLTRPSLPSRIADRLVVGVFNKTVGVISGSVRRRKWARERLGQVQVIKGITFCERTGMALDIYAPLDVELPDIERLMSAEQEQSEQEQSEQGQSEQGQSEQRGSSERHPFALYIHGGGFILFSKDSHWPFGLKLAEAGFITFVINYRLAPQHPCPAGLEDCATALTWILKRQTSLKLDTARGLIAGESAGGNLTLALALCLSRRGESAWERELFDLGWTPKMIAPACAFLDVSGEGRLPDEMHPLFAWRVRSLGRKYLGRSARPELGEPLAELVSGVTLERPLPPTLITVGDNDPVYRDSVRLAEELKRRELEHQLIIYPKGIHTFHAAIHKPLAEACWRDHFEYWAGLA